MRRLKRKIQNRQYGQAMAEFALTLPIFLLLVFGVIELSRFFLVYSSVFTAVREATRYGSSVGELANPNYQNCEMMVETAVRMGNFGGVQTDDVIIYFESEPGTWVADCDPSEDPEDRYQPVLGDRVVVEINTDYDSLLGIVPDLTVSAKNGRTIMLGVQSQVSVINTVTPGGEATATLTQVPTQIPTQTDVPTATPTEDATAVPTVGPTNIPSEVPTFTATINPKDFCPSESVNFAGEFVKKGNFAWEIKLKNDSDIDFELESITNFVWATGNGAKLTKIEWAGEVIWPKSPLNFSWSDNQRSSISGKEDGLPLKFTFDKNTNNVSITSLLLSFENPSGTCTESLPL